MSIDVNANQRVFHLATSASSYVISVSPYGHLWHQGWGPRLDSWNGSASAIPVERAFSPTLESRHPEASLDLLPQEFPTAADTDFRVPALLVTHPDGSRQADLRYSGFRTLPGKPPLPGLPCAYVEQVDEADTLEIDLVDAPSGLCVTLVYSVYRDRDVIARSVRVTAGSRPVVLDGVMSLSMDLGDADYDLITLGGAWARERGIHRRPLPAGLSAVESRRGASSHQQHPFVALARPGSDERRGEVLGFCLVYSGSFTARVEVDPWRQTRVQMGIQPESFRWPLGPGEVFSSPEVIMVRSDSGWGTMSRTFHKLMRERVARGPWRDRERPILLNNWEATYFSFDEQKLLALADVAASVGIELFVLDDGWFGHRDNDLTSLGDWTVDRRKLPHGLDNLGSQLLDRGLTFGLWVEPEMVSQDSDLYRAHPDWCLQVPGRPLSEGRNQLVLDLSRSEVQNFLISTLTELLRENPISYVKWDMNRHHALVGHAQILGLYRVLEQITSAFPAILFESCSGGGGRFDAGMLFYMPQAWTSDNTDALDRAEIQWGTSLVFPPSSMGAHVSAVPNHQVGRTVPLSTRYHVARTGAFGYELDLLSLSAQERSEIAQQIAEYRRDRRLLQQGEFYRLVDPSSRLWSAWMSVSHDQTEAVVTVVVLRAQANGPQHTLWLDGLNPVMRYTCAGREGSWTGRELMTWGWRLQLPVQDGASVSLRFVAGVA